MKCPKCHALLKSVLTRSSVLIDVCSHCRGTWLDQGELNFFAKDQKILEEFNKNGLQEVTDTLLSCPKCEVNMKAGKIPGFKYEVEECPTCCGLWFDSHEFHKISQSNEFIGMAKDRKTSIQTLPLNNFSKNISPAPSIPSLGFVSTCILLTLYSILFGFIVFLVEYQQLPSSWGVMILFIFILFQFFFGPIVLDWSLRLFGSLNWIELSELPDHLQQFIKKVCIENQIPIPRLGIINDGSPQAYTYGRSSSSARLVLSRGILEILEPDESEAVVAHELGHIVHWDFVFMTIAQLVPIIFYQIYLRLKETSKKRSGKIGTSILMASVIAYVAFVITGYLVMFFSRVREYWADYFSVKTTQNPNALVRALGKIAYGMVANSKPIEDGEYQSSVEQKKMAVQAMGIMSVQGSKELTLYSSQFFDGSVNNLKEIMRWDLWTPWATYYELQSTHPLTAKRINAISTQAIRMQIQPELIFDLQKPESYWDQFIKDLFIISLPVIGALIAIAPKIYFLNFGFQSLDLFMGQIWNLGFSVMIGMSLGGLLKTMLCYPNSHFSNFSIISLLKMIKVSPVTAYSVRIKGKVIGRGIPGSIFSEDMVVRDSSGMIFLDYQHGISNLFFAFFKLDQFVGKEVEIEGWYRRAPIPFIEVKTIRTSTEFARSYSYYYSLLAWFFVILAAFLIKLYGSLL